jgi:hypothetical protein
MEKEVLVKNTIGKLEQLPARRIHEVIDYVEYIIQKSHDDMIVEGLQQLSSISRANDFLYEEPELYSLNDLKVRFV